MCGVGADGRHVWVICGGVWDDGRSVSVVCGGVWNNGRPASVASIRRLSCIGGQWMTAAVYRWSVYDGCCVSVVSV